MSAATCLDTAVTLTRMTGEDHPEYAAFLARIPDSLIYYSLGFKSFLEDMLACEGEYWLAREDGRITGVLPLMWRDGPLGRVINSLPFYGSNGGALAETAAAERALTERFNALAAMPGVASATWICHPLRTCNGASVAHDMEDERISQFTSLDLGDDPQRTLADRIDGSARRNIRKAETGGVRVFVDNDRLDFLERTHRENMAAIGGKAKPAGFFQKLPLHLAPGGDYRIYVAERGGSPIAALLLLYFQHTVEYYIPAIVEAERSHQPTALILAQAMTEAARSGYRLWNWGGTWLTQTGVWQFKKKWGAQNRPYRYFVKVNASAILSCPRERLLSDYPDFYVCPFNQLRESNPKP